MPHTVTKADLAMAICSEVGLNKREAHEFVSAFFEQVSVSLENGVPVKLSGFGSFATRDKAQRPGRNPKTGEPAVVQARRVVTFRPSRQLREALRDRVIPLRQPKSKS